MGNYLYADVPGFSEDARQDWWRVSARGPGGTSAWSSVRTLYNTITSCTPYVGSGSGYLTTRSHLDTCRVTTNALPAYYLHDISRRAGAPAGHSHGGRMALGAAIQTKKYVSDTVAATADDIDNQWYAPSQRSAVDAHGHTAIVYDHLNLQVELNAHDNLGGTMLSRVEVPVVTTMNASWDPVANRVSYTVPFGTTVPFSAALDVVAHEWSHGVECRSSWRTVNTSPWGESTRCLYQAYQSGALREGFADWFGTATEVANGESNWTIGEGSQIVRSLQNPPSYGQPGPQPDTYLGTNYLDFNTTNCPVPALPNDYCGIHTNSGVPNKMFYLLAAGGVHNNVAVQPITVEKAMAVGMRANLAYWRHDVTFQLALADMVSAANDLYSDMPELPDIKNQIRNAWAAVRVGTIPIVSVTAQPLAAGSVTGSGSYPFGTTVTVEATPYSGYRFSRWLEGEIEVTTDARYTFTVDSSRSLVASFAELEPNISVSPPAYAFGTYETGAISPPQTFTVTNGGQGVLRIATVLVVGANYAEFPIVTDGCTGRDLSTDSNCAIQVQFAPVSVGPLSATISIPSNDPDTPTASVTLSGSGAVPLTRTITATAGTGGTISPSGAVSVPYDGTQTFTIVPGLGYQILDVAVDGVSVGALSSYTFVHVVSDHTISATCGLIPYTITATSGPGGTIAPAGSVTTYYGGSATFSITPNAGAEIANVLVDGVSVGAVSAYTFTNVSANHTIHASFRSTLSVVPSGTGTGTVTSNPSGINCGTDCTEPYSGGTAVTLSAVAAAGSVFSGWSGSGCSGTGTCAVTMTTNTTVTATFTLSPPDISVAPVSYNFGSYIVGQSSSPQTFTVTNSGGANLSIGTVSIGGGNLSDFVKVGDTCTGLALQRNNSCTLQVSFAPQSAGSKTASVSIPSNDPDTPALSVPLSGTAVAPPAPVLSISKTASIAAAIPGQYFDYTISYVNTGEVEATGVRIRDFLPLELDYAGSTSEGCNWNFADRSVDCYLLTQVFPGTRPLLPNQPESLNIQVRVRDDIRVNSVTNGAYQIECNEKPPATGAPVTTTIYAPILQISKTDSRDPVRGGQFFKYTLSYVNVGNQDATNVEIRDVLPPEVGIVSLPEGCGFSIADRTVVCTLQTQVWPGTRPLSPNQPESLFFTVQVNAGVPTGTVITNATYSIDSDQTTPYYGAPITTTVN